MVGCHNQQGIELRNSIKLGQLACIVLSIRARRSSMWSFPVVERET